MSRVCYYRGTQYTGFIKSTPRFACFSIREWLQSSLPPWVKAETVGTQLSSEALRAVFKAILTLIDEELPEGHEYVICDCDDPKVWDVCNSLEIPEMLYDVMGLSSYMNPGSYEVYGDWTSGGKGVLIARDADRWVLNHASGISCGYITGADLYPEEFGK